MNNAMLHDGLFCIAHENRYSEIMGNIESLDTSNILYNESIVFEQMKYHY